MDQVLSKTFPRAIKFAILAIILLETVSSSQASSLNNSKADHPQISLHAYKGNGNNSDITRIKAVFGSKKDYRNEFVSKTGNDYVVSNMTELAVFTCESGYPITWKLPMPRMQQITSPLAEGTLRLLEYRDSDFSPNSTEPVATRFRLFMTINFDPIKFLSINVTCVSAQKQPEIQSSIHISLENGTSNDPGTPITESFVPKSSFNGTAGLTFAPSRPNLDIHMCAGPQLTCCSGAKRNPPKMYMMPCFTPLRCEISKRVLMDNVRAEVGYKNYDVLLGAFGPGNNKTDHPTDCTRKILLGPSSLVVCKGDTVDYAQQFVSVFHPRANGPVKNRSKDIRESDPGQERISLSKYETASMAQRVNLTQRMMILVGHPTPDHFRKRLAASSSFPMHFRQVHDPLLKATDAVLPVRDLPREIRRMDIFAERQLMEFGRDVYYEGETLTVMCFGIKFFHASGAHLRLNWKNGTRSILGNGTSPTGAKRVGTNLYLSGRASFSDGWGMELVPIFGIPVVASLEMSSVDCWMPVRNSGKWDKMSRSLQIRPSVAPRIAEKTEETVHFNLGDKGKVLICTIMDAVPYPSLEVSGDWNKGRAMEYDNEVNSGVAGFGGNGTSLTESVDREKRLITFKIIFERVTKAAEGKWNCKAWNVKGFVERTIKVVVKDNNASLS